MWQCSGKVLNRSEGYCRAFDFSVTEVWILDKLCAHSSCYFLFFFCISNFSFCFFLALIVRFLTKRFIGDYEANTGEFLHI